VRHVCGRSVKCLGFNGGICFLFFALAHMPASQTMNSVKISTAALQFDALYPGHLGKGKNEEYAFS